MRRNKWGWGSSGAAVLRLLPCLSGVPCFSGVPGHVVLQDSREGSNDCAGSLWHQCKKRCESI